MLFLKFAALQVLDMLTTLWFLQDGVREANPLVRAALAAWAEPAWALAGVKLAALVPAWWAWRSKRHGLLRKINLLFAACVVWNVTVLWFQRATL